MLLHPSPRAPSASVVRPTDAWRARVASHGPGRFSVARSIVVGVAAMVAACSPAVESNLVVEGLPAGAACAADLVCATGLSCACGRCAPVGAVDAPVVCDNGATSACPESPSFCVAACGDSRVVGSATCEDGIERCEGTGVVPDLCPADTCWGEPQPGERCEQGEFVCALGRSTRTGLCITDDCEGEAPACVEACSAEAFPARCLGGSFRCERGFPAVECDGCLGEAPPCVAGCDDPRIVAIAYCDQSAPGAPAYRCDHVLGAVLATSCPAPGPADGGPSDAGVLDLGPVDAGLTER